MTKKEILEIYSKNYTEDNFFKQNVTYAFSQEQLQQAIKKLGATSKDDLTSLGCGSLCLKSKAQEIIKWILEKEQEKREWIKKLSRKEQEYIIDYELRNYECDYTWDITNVVDLFKGIFEYNEIMTVFHKITKQ